MSDHWWVDAACRLENADLFAEQGSEPNDTARSRLLKAANICRRCPSQEPCLTEAIANKDNGMRGGILLVGGQKRRIPRHPPPVPRDEMGLQPCGTYAAYQRHLRHETPVCGPCAQAGRDKNHTYRPKKRARKAA